MKQQTKTILTGIPLHFFESFSVEWFQIDSLMKKKWFFESRIENLTNTLAGTYLYREIQNTVPIRTWWLFSKTPSSLMRKICQRIAFLCFLQSQRTDTVYLIFLFLYRLAITFTKPSEIDHLLIHLCVPKLYCFHLQLSKIGWISRRSYWW